jgi:hypothetical protein
MICYFTNLSTSDIIGCGLTYTPSGTGLNKIITVVFIPASTLSSGTSYMLTFDIRHTSTAAT